MCHNFRTELKLLLGNWKQGGVDLKDMHSKSEDLYEAFLSQGSEKDLSESNVFYALSILEVMNYQIIIKDDIEMLLMLIKDDSIINRSHWEVYWQGIDWGERKKNVKNNDFYIL